MQERIVRLIVRGVQIGELTSAGALDLMQALMATNDEEALEVLEEDWGLPTDRESDRDRDRDEY